ncbi:antiviral innate immune response receptor RIG-I-like [Antedon mediterranea]|uniref:antiviral innate immune response receptor RIG-I-like n=1 Tax=Antedon mediterranea TaxID=105859 RepID=UPI003AF9B5DF
MDVQHQLIIVFRRYLRSNLKPSSSFLSLLYADIEVIKDQQDVIQSLKQSGTPDSKIVDKILDLLASCNEQGWFKSFLSALSNDEATPRNKDVADYITGLLDFQDMTEHRGLLQVFESDLLETVEPGNLLRNLPTLSTEDKECIRTSIDRLGATIATAELLIRVQRGGDEWFKELISALREADYAELVELLQPLEEENVPTANESIEEESNENSNNIQNQYRAEDSDSDKETINEKYDDGKEKQEKAKSKELVLRNYQITLAKPVIGGQNTIIISHTGSGKTVVAVHFVREHIKEQEAKLNVKPKKVIFLVNTISLVSQQHDLFKKYMPESLRLAQLIGDNVQQLATLKNAVENNDIIFLTAQMLVNALEKNELKIDDFTMLVFDECHHCHGQNPYNIIMAKYRRRKLEDEKATLPQIVGLTASIGTGRASSQEKSDEYAKSIFANLDADEISIPDENDDEYRLHVNPPEEIDPIMVKPRSDDADPFKTEIVTIMSEIEKIMGERVHKQGTMSEGLADLFNFTKSVKGTSSYEQGVEKFISHSPECVTSNDSLLRLMRTGGEHLRKYNDALKMNKICRIQDALRFIKEFIKKEESTRSDGLNEDDKQLIRLFKDREEELQYVSGEKKFENPLLSKLEDVLIGEYKTKVNAHAIIFCTKRTTVDAMYSWIKENERLSFLKPEKVFGSSEMTAVDQHTVLENFKENRCNILVGTNVVEEGTDVPACNLVFRYNYMSSDVGRTQAKGRVRQKNSKFYMIASTEFNFEERDQANKIRHQFMTKSVRTLSKLPKDQLKEELLALQTIDLREQFMSEKRERERQQKRTETRYKLLCGKCSEFACYSTDVKVFNDSNHLIVDQEFYGKILTQKHPKPKVIGDDIYKNGKVACKKCNHDWGVIVTISSMNFAVIKIVSFVLEKCADRKRKTVKKWKESPFKVEPLDINNFKQQNPDWSIDLDYKQ